MAHEEETVNDDTTRELPGKEVCLPFLFLGILYLSRQTFVLQFMLEAPLGVHNSLFFVHKS